MTYDNYRDQGQQDDYFETDISRAGNQAKAGGDYDDYRNQGQQDDYFEADISSAINNAKEDGED